MSYSFKVRCLSPAFYQRYPNTTHIDILTKQRRAYNCVVIENGAYHMCIPYRSNICHKYAYMFSTSVRSMACNSGLDYTKMVIVSNPAFLDEHTVAIDRDEYIETMKNIETITSEARQFLNDYIQYKSGAKPISGSEFKKRYRYSTLKYFHEELMIEDAAKQNVEKQETYLLV